jgi:hypothetical protein
VLPGLVTVLMPISYRQLMSAAQKALITIFAAHPRMPEADPRGTQQASTEYA